MQIKFLLLGSVPKNLPTPVIPEQKHAYEIT